MILSDLQALLVTEAFYGFVGPLEWYANDYHRLAFLAWDRARFEEPSGSIA